MIYVISKMRPNFTKSADANVNASRSFVPLVKSVNTDPITGEVVKIYNVPTKGDLIYYGTASSGWLEEDYSKYTISHVGIVESYDASTNTINTIEGNTWNGQYNGMVYWKSFKVENSVQNVVGFSRVYS